SGVATGQNLLALDLQRVRQELEMNPWIERADVEAIRPDRVRLTIRERDPVAQIIVWRFSPVDRSAWAETNFVDPGGMVLPPLRPDWVRSPELADFS
ncbi:FtsQ-type POTRA domain-containing protein, partial [Clostridium perfringens]|nr:FtsQ-type POTRA domain-containing protein [Clostridium perfringens]